MSVRLAIQLGLAAAPLLASCASAPEDVTVGPSAPPVTHVTEMAASEPSGPGAPTYRSEDFVESPRNRDPFRRFVPEVRPPHGVDGVLRSARIDELSVVAVVSGVASPIAMVTTRHGQSHSVQRGDFVGRDEIVTTTGQDGLTYSLRWRVESVSPRGVELACEEPSGSTQRRLLALHDDTEAS